MLTVVLSRRTIRVVPADVEYDALDGDQGWAAGVRACDRSLLVFVVRSREAVVVGVVPSHLLSSSAVIGSSLGGSSWTGTLGEKRLGSGSCSTIVELYVLFGLIYY